MEDNSKKTARKPVISSKDDEGIRRPRRRSSIFGATALSVRAKSSMSKPIPQKMTTGRASVPPGRLSSTASTVNKTATFCAKPFRTPVAPRPAARPSSTIPRPVRQVPVKQKSEAEILREKVANLEEQLAGNKDLLEMKNENLEMLKEKLEHTQQKLEHKTDMLEMKDAKLEKLARDVETSTENVSKLSTQNHELIKQLMEKEEVLRKLHNDVVDLRGQIRVAIRVRKQLPAESKKSTEAILYPAIDAISLDVGKPIQFEFEKVFTPVFSQLQVFENVKELILSCLHGFNVSLIAFGQTGSGKTYTMRGGDDEEQGVIPRSASFLFEQSKLLEALGWQFEFSLSFVEIYNNEASDLLNNSKILKVRLNGQDVLVDGLTTHSINNTSEVDRLLRKADAARKTSSTKCNEQSSRSHVIYQWVIKAEQPSTNMKTTSVLKLVDLAGSERAKESGVVGDRFKEMTHINKSLSTLQKCINMQKGKASHVPYRDSKLTELLKDCLGAGSSKTMVLVNINPCDEQAQESKRSLEFAAKMRDTKIGTALQQRDMNPKMDE